MRLFVVLILVFAIPANGSAQKNQTIPVALSTVQTHIPFYLSRARTAISTSSNFKGIPSGLKDYKIKERDFPASNEKLFILYGITQDNKRLIAFDSNFDNSFSNEQVYLFDKDVTFNREREKMIIDTTRAVGIYLRQAPPIYLKPDLFNCCYKYLNPLDSIWHLLIETHYYREGFLKIDGQPFKVAVSASHTPYFGGLDIKAFLLPGDKSFEEENNNNEPYKLGQPVIVNKQEFVLDSVSLFGDTVWVVYKGFKEQAQGDREGLYALRIQANSIHKTPFDLKENKGNYVLLDFWGTWCSPCIALIPKLRLLHETYKAKGFRIVSIAYDKKESYAKLLNMVKTKRMDWINIFDDQAAKGSITDQYNVSCFPTSILIAPDGKIIFRSCGEDDFLKLEKKIRESFE